MNNDTLASTLVLPDGGRLKVAGSAQGTFELAQRFEAEIEEGWDD